MEDKNLLKKALDKVKANTKKGSKNFYKPLPKEDSKLVRGFYKEQMAMHHVPINGNPNYVIKNSEGTLIANGFTRVVIGDYGPYIEFSKDQVVLENIQNRWPGKPNRSVKYIWMVTKDKIKTKVYFQQGTVSYADYKVGMYYVDPRDCYIFTNNPFFNIDVPDMIS